MLLIEISRSGKYIPLEKHVIILLKKNIFVYTKHKSTINRKNIKSNDLKCNDNIEKNRGYLLFLFEDFLLNIS